MLIKISVSIVYLYKLLFPDAFAAALIRHFNLNLFVSLYYFWDLLIMERIGTSTDSKFPECGDTWCPCCSFVLAKNWQEILKICLSRTTWTTRLKTAGDLGKDRHYRSKSQIKRLMVVVHKYKSKAGMYHVRKPSTKINTILVTLLLGFRVDADPAWVFAACQVRKQDDLHGFCMFSKSPICLFHYRKFTFA